MPGLYFKANGTVESASANYYDITTIGYPVESVILDSSVNNPISIDQNSSCSFVLDMVMRSLDGTQHAHMSRQGLIVRDINDNIGFVGTIYTFGIDNNVPGWSIHLTLDSINFTFNVSVPGTQLWLGRLDIIRIKPTGN